MVAHLIKKLPLFVYQTKTVADPYLIEPILPWQALLHLWFFPSSSSYLISYNHQEKHNTLCCTTGLTMKTPVSQNTCVVFPYQKLANQLKSICSCLDPKKIDCLYKWTLIRTNILTQLQCYAVGFWTESGLTNFQMVCLSQIRSRVDWKKRNPNWFRFGCDFLTIFFLHVSLRFYTGGLWIVIV